MPCLCFGNKQPKHVVYGEDGSAAKPKFKKEFLRSLNAISEPTGDATEDTREPELTDQSVPGAESSGVAKSLSIVIPGVEDVVESPGTSVSITHPLPTPANTTGVVTPVGDHEAVVPTPTSTTVDFKTHTQQKRKKSKENKYKKGEGDEGFLDMIARWVAEILE